MTSTPTMWFFLAIVVMVFVFYSIEYLLRRKLGNTQNIFKWEFNKPKPRHHILTEFVIMGVFILSMFINLTTVMINPMYVVLPFFFILLTYRGVMELKINPGEKEHIIAFFWVGAVFIVTVIIYLMEPHLPTEIFFTDPWE
ncbi:DUF4181 domain-containing protein [Alteribacter keqinensis]|uniref:DUF4181 domain-containing protein n=1 Tax=Alteribacter keqinensis TaxID=2483800 RepID=A0A3M7TWH2_9BACI|nr:DUF4181 domain-containing protein [Alteribacter keqinensis]RNA69967.1 DUF4181 domain-containing protein [Alteribacter keqinensis]